MANVKIQKRECLLLNVSKTYITTSESITVLSHILFYLNDKEIGLFGICSNEFYKQSSNDIIWKPLCIKRWPELKMSKSIDSDPFPAWKSCYIRKNKEDSTSYSDIIKIFGACDFYSCPNGHLYVIGECRLPVQSAKCPECGLNIGGKYHRMIESNNHLGSVNSVYNPFVSEIYEDDIKFKDIASTLMNNNNDTESKMDSNNEYTSIGTRILNNIDSDTKMQTINESALNEDIFKGYTLDDPPEYLVCPLSMELFEDPMVTPKGKIYEKEWIYNWLQSNTCDPIQTNVPLKISDLKPEPQIKNACNKFMEYMAKQNKNNE